MATTSSPSRERPRRFEHPGRVAIVVAGLVIVAVLVLVVAFGADTSDTSRAQNIDVTSVSPAADTIVPPQQPLTIDLTDDLTAEISVCGPTGSCVAIPADQVEFAPALGRLMFQPGTGKEILGWQPGRNTVVLSIRKQAAPDSEINSYRWTFVSKS